LRTRLLMTVTAAALGLSGAAAMFLPQEILAGLGTGADTVAR